MKRFLLTLPIVGLLGTLFAAEPVSPVVSVRPEYRPRFDSYSPTSVPMDQAMINVSKFKAFEKPKLRVANNTIKVLFLARTRPVTIEVTVTDGGKPLVDRWARVMREVFDSFDRDGNGYLNVHEVDHVHSRGEIRGLLVNGYSYRGQAGALPKPGDLDADRDGKVTFDEYLNYYEFEIPPFVRTLNNNLPYQQADTATPQIFARLDKNGDGKISADEFQLAEKLLGELDTDEDETVSLNELLTNPLDKNTPLVTPNVEGSMMMRGNPNAARMNSDLQVFVGDIPGATIQKIIAKYDKNGDYELERSEIGITDSDLKKIDKNGDGKLSATELDTWRTKVTDLVAEISLNDDTKKIVCTISAGQGCTEGIKLTKAESTLTTIARIDGQVLDLGTALNPYARQNVQNYDYLFMNGKKFFTENELNNPQFQFIRVIFDAADFDGDGRLTKEELNRYFQLQAKIAAIPVIYLSSTRVPSLFNMIDTNKDGKLSIRELRDAYRNLIGHEPTGGKEVTKAILQPAGSLRVGFGPNPPYDYAQYQNQYQNPYGNPSVTPKDGPIWFRKMDRNGDGDISPTEFLGSKDDFKAIDINGDGLISLEEAKAFDETMRKGK